MEKESEMDVDSLMAELEADGNMMTKEEAQLAVERLAELLLLISAPLPLPPARSDHQGEANQSLLRDESDL